MFSSRRFDKETRGIELKFHEQRLDHLTACEGCDLLLTSADPPPGHSSVCPRCDTILTRRSTHSIAKTLSLSITGLLLYFPALLFPLMTFESFGFSDSANIIESILIFFHSGYYFVSFMVLISAVIFPFLLLSLIFILSLNLRLKRYPPFFTWIL